MMFMEAFSPKHRALFEHAAEPLSLPAGGFVLRRGEAGGDLFFLKSGTLDVVDSRRSPEVILAQLHEGTVVGEMAFVDNSPRSADVRASEPSEILRWGRDDLRALLDHHPDFAARFFENVARLAAERIRRLTDNTVAGAFSAESAPSEDLDEVLSWVERITHHAKRHFPPVEARLRRDGEDSSAILDLHDLLDHLQAEVDELLSTHPSPALAGTAAEVLQRELHPWLVRSSLADRCLRRPQGVSGMAEILAHILVNIEGGDGHIGTAIDRWLLDRPTFAALRAVRRPIVEEVRRLLPHHRNRRVMVINAGTGSLVAAMSETLGGKPTIITVVDQSRDALSFLDAGMLSRPRGIALHAVPENLARFAMNGPRNELPHQDAIVIHGLLEYMPERVAVSMLNEARKLLGQDGVLVCATLGPSEDQRLIDRLLAWPTIRRAPRDLDTLFQAAGFDVVLRTNPEGTPGHVYTAITHGDLTPLTLPSSRFG